MKASLRLNRHLSQRLGFSLLSLVTLATVIPILAVVIYILLKGAPAISWEFLTGFPHDGMRQGGILPAIVGTFYRSPSPDADPYVEEGDSVKKGQVLCVVEAMKLMNEIESEVDGRLVKILVENTKSVEYGQALFLIDPKSAS